jgi:GH35 family endo-1,4-beta-xylanase
MEPEQDVTDNWFKNDQIYRYAKNTNTLFKAHALIWGSQAEGIWPSWIDALTAEEQFAQTREHIQKFCETYPDVPMIDVVNEAVTGHHPPPSKYQTSLGGASGYQWVINIFEMARQYCPNSLLVYNDYSVLSGGSLSEVLNLANAVKSAGYLDAIGCQAHGLESASAASVKSALDQVTAVAPAYISEFDLNIADDNQQLTKMQELFPVFYDHPKVWGITLWGYVQGETWIANSHLRNTDGSERPALTWLKDNYLTKLSFGY